MKEDEKKKEKTTTFNPSEGLNRFLNSIGNIDDDALMKKDIETKPVKVRVTVTKKKTKTKTTKKKRVDNDNVDNNIN